MAAFRLPHDGDLKVAATSMGQRGSLKTYISKTWISSISILEKEKLCLDQLLSCYYHVRIELSPHFVLVKRMITATITSKKQIMKPITKSVDDIFGILHSPSITTQSIEDMDNAIRRRIDEAWAKESERQIDAYDAGKISARPVEDVMRNLKL